MPMHCPPSRAPTAAPPARWRAPQTCDLNAPPWPVGVGPEAADVGSDCPTLDAFEAAGAPTPAPAPAPADARERFPEPTVTIDERHPLFPPEEPWGPLAVPGADDAVRTKKDDRPKLWSGEISEDAEGHFRGARGHIGLNHEHRGTTVSAFTTGGAVGWGGDLGLYGVRRSGTLVGGSHDPARAGESGFWYGLNALDGGLDAYHDAERGQGEWSYRLDAVNGAAGARGIDPDSSSDRGVRLGAGVGISAAGLRWYNQDADSDNRREVGFGLSTPAPLGLGASFDYTTESPLGDLVSLMCPISLPIQAAMVALGAEAYTPAFQIQRAADGLWTGESGPAPGHDYRKLHREEP